MSKKRDTRSYCVIEKWLLFGKSVMYRGFYTWEQHNEAASHHSGNFQFPTLNFLILKHDANNCHFAWLTALPRGSWSRLDSCTKCTVMTQLDSLAHAIRTICQKLGVKRSNYQSKIKVRSAFIAFLKTMSEGSTPYVITFRLKFRC